MTGGGGDMSLMGFCVLPVSVSEGNTFAKWETLTNGENIFWAIFEAEVFFGRMRRTGS